MKYYVEDSLSNFHFWSGAEDRAAMLTDDQFEVVEQNMEECAPADGWSDTAINDFFWFEFDTIAQWLGYKDEEYLSENVSDDDISDADDWFDNIDDDTTQEFNIVTMGYNLEHKFELNTFEHYKFMDMEEAELWAETYFLYLNDFEYYVHPSEESVYNIEP